MRPYSIIRGNAAAKILKGCGILGIALFIFAHPLGAQDFGKSLRADLKRLMAFPEAETDEVISLGEDMLLRLTQEPHDALEMRVRYRLGVAHLAKEEFQSASLELGVGLHLARGLGDTTMQLMCISYIVFAENVLGEFDASMQHADEGIALAKAINRTDIEWKLINDQGTIFERKGEMALALDRYAEALAIADQSKETDALGSLLNNIGVAYNNLGQPESAFDFLDRAIQIFEEGDDVGMHATGLANMADSLSMMGQHEDALLMHHGALEMVLECCPGLSEAITRNAIAKDYLRMGEFEKAIPFAKDALTITERLGLPGEGILPLAHLAEAYAGLDRGDEALSFAQAGKDISDALDRKGLRMTALQALAEAHRTQGDFEKALGAQDEAIDVEREIRSFKHQQQLAEFGAEYENDQKLNEIALLTKENELKTRELELSEFIGYAALGGLGLVLCLGVVGLRARNRRRRWDSVLRESERHQEILANLSPVGFFRTDASGKLIYANERWLEIMGLCEEEAMQGVWLSRVYPKDRERVLKEWQEGTQQNQPFQSDHRVLCQHETTRSVLAQVVPELDDEGTLIGFVGTLTDMTSQYQMEESVREAQKMSGLGMLAGGIAHDFNNILASIVGNASLASMDPELSPECSDKLGAIVHAGERAADLCSQLLAYAGRGQLKVESMDLNASVREMSELYRVLVGPKATVHLELDWSLSPVMGDATQLRQVILNLMTNAAEALEGNEGHVHLSTRMELHAPEQAVQDFTLPDDNGLGYSVLCVEDDGCGFDESTTQSLFDPFFTTKVSGHGLGMAAVLGIVRAHSGAICMESIPGQGTRVEVYVPATSAVPPAPAELPVKVIPVGRSATVLVVDDEAAIREFAREALLQADHQVILASDGKEALHAFERVPGEVDLVLMDVIMPHMDGIESFYMMRALRDELPVIFSSGYTREESLAGLDEFGDGPVLFIKKPYRPDELLAMVNSLLEQDQESASSV